MRKLTPARLCTKSPNRFVFLCGPLRISATSAFKTPINRRERKDTQRAAEKIAFPKRLFVQGPPALYSLLIILALTVSAYPGAQVPTNQDVISRARSSYYNLQKKGFKGFTATIEPNWEVILAHTATPENLKVFRAVQFWMIVDANGAVTVRHEVGANAAKPELKPVVDRIHYDVQRLVTGFFNTWRMFMVGSPFPETENKIKIEKPAAATAHKPSRVDTPGC